ncbi:MAG TPA: ABC transporter substrate-binding protein [Chloroflexota bacterium]|nr:ABC transporter substrate-binding protein [Chloroflexota bacterium]
MAVVAPATAVRASFSIMSGALGPFWVAQEAGLWQQHGLDVDLSLISGAPTSMAALMAGDTRFAIAAGDSVLGVQAQNPDVVAILNTSVGSTHQLMVVPDIHTPADLRGRRVGVNSIGDGSYTLLSKAFRHLGLDPTHDVIWTAMGGGNAASYVTGLAVGSLDAAPLTPPNDLLAERQGAHSLLALADLDLATAGLPAFTMRHTIQEQRPVVEAFAAGVVDGVRRFKADPAFAREVLAQKTGTTDPEVLDWTYQVYSGRNSTDRPFIDAARLQTVVDDLAVAQPELRQIQLDKTFDNSILDDLERQGYFAQ